MGSIGGAEILMILVLALLLFGPRSLPKIGRTIGRGLAEFRKASSELKSNLVREVEMEELRETQDGLKSAEREIRKAVGEIGSLEVARGSIQEPESAPSDAGAPPSPENTEPKQASVENNAPERPPDPDADDASKS